MKLTFTKAAVCAAALSLALSSCAKGASSGSYAANKKMLRMAKSAPMEEAVMADMTAEYDAGQMAPVQSARQERKLIYSGSLHLEVQSLAEAKASVESWVKKFGGYISNSSEGTSSISITAGIPSASFEEAMNECGKIGRLKSKNIYTDDVTDRFYDLETRLSTRKVLLERLQKYLSEAKDMQDMLKIETKINDITSELEQMQGQMNRLSSQIEYSQISISAELPVNQDENGFILPDARSRAREFCANTVTFFVNFAFFALYAVIFGIPVILFAMLIYWLGLGKVGLLRKLFKRISAGKKEEAAANP